MTRQVERRVQRTRIEVPRGFSVRSQVYSLIREAIVSLQLTPGRALSENELAEEYGVSRTPVREALIRLADEGLVEVVPQLGTFVSRIAVRDVREAQFIREALERASLPQVVAQISEQDGVRLRGLLDAQRAAAAQHDLRRWFELDEDLHRSLLEIAGHRRVWSIVQSAKAHMDRVRMLSLPEPEVLEELIAQHAEIVDLVLAGEHEAADRILVAHLRLALDYLEVFESRYPDYFLDEDAKWTPRRARADRR